MTFRASALRLGIAAAALALTAGTAKAFTDSTYVWGYNRGIAETSSSYARWVDQIPTTTTTAFNTTAIKASRVSAPGTSNNSVILTLFTAWTIGKIESNAASGDIWLDHDQNGTFESAIVFDKTNTSGEPTTGKYVRAPVGFYDGINDPNGRTVAWKTVFDVWGTTNAVVGQKYCTTCTLNSTNPPPTDAAAKDTLSVVDN